tara:strand:- start:320 stop:877 length:558 start_codon:yes stop_codon:yes gene_type:complete
MFIQTENTPNPSTLKFVPGEPVMKEGTIFIKNKNESKNSPLAQRIFKIEGIKNIFFGSDFITVSINDSSQWELTKPLVLSAIADHYASNEEIIDKNSLEKKEDSKKEDSEIIKQIKELIETRVRPAVAMDGGDIIFNNFEDGIVYLQMQGACSGCPSSTATLKTGIENMLKHYIPEVIEVRPIAD